MFRAVGGNEECLTLSSVNPWNSMSSSSVGALPAWLLHAG
jgi:hypothetical protein